MVHLKDKCIDPSEQNEDQSPLLSTSELNRSQIKNLSTYLFIVNSTCTWTYVKPYRSLLWLSKLSGPEDNIGQSG